MPLHLTYWGLIWRRFRQHRLAQLSLFILLLLTVLAVSAHWLEQWLGVSSMQVNLFHRLQPPSNQHWLGTDELGRDFLLRLLYGGRVSLLVGIVGALAATCIGTVIGLLAGYFGGRVDTLLMRITDAIIALPLLPLLIVLAALDLDKLGLPADWVQSDNVSVYRIIVIVALFGWTTVARLVRSATLSVREREYVRAAIATGASSFHVMRVHILPNVMSPIIIATTLSVGNIILLESVLSFLGLGILPPLPSWGNMLNNAQELIWSNAALAFYPGMMIFITVIAFNFLGDGLQDALNPKMRRYCR